MQVPKVSHCQNYETQKMRNVSEWNLMSLIVFCTSHVTVFAYLYHCLDRLCHYLLSLTHCRAMWIIINRAILYCSRKTCHLIFFCLFFDKSRICYPELISKYSRLFLAGLAIATVQGKATSESTNPWPFWRHAKFVPNMWSWQSRALVGGIVRKGEGEGGVRAGLMKFGEGPLQCA